jgi:hypothetical protein
MSGRSEQHRQKIRRRAEELIAAGKPAEVVQAESIVAAYLQQVEQARQILARADRPLPQRACPDCFDVRDTLVALHSAPHPSRAERYDRWQCRKCGYVEDEYVAELSP